MNTICIDIARFTRLTNEEYKALQEHPYSRQSLDSYRRVSDSDWCDYSLVQKCIRELNTKSGRVRVWRHDTLVDTRENRWGVFAKALCNAMAIDQTDIAEYKWLPVNEKTTELLNALGCNVDCGDGSVVAVMFIEFTDGE